MKTLLLTLSLATAVVSTSQAQIYRPSVVRDTTVLGAVAGALIGGHNNDRWAEGAIIGAAAGALIGSAVDQSGPVAYRQRVIQPVSVVACAPTVVTAAPRVVYFNPPSPRVVYVQSYARPVIVSRPVVYVSNNHNRAYGYNRSRGYVYRRDRDDCR